MLGSDEFRALKEHMFRLENDQRKILQIVEDHGLSADERDAAILESLKSMRTHMQVIAGQLASRRVVVTPVAMTTPRAPDDTHTDLAAQANALATTGAEPSQVAAAILGTLGMWRRRPHLVLGAVGAVCTLLIAFGAQVTQLQQAAIGGAIIAIVALFADARADRTLKKSVAVAAATPTNAHPSERPPAQ